MSHCVSAWPCLESYPVHSLATNTQASSGDAVHGELTPIVLLHMMHLIPQSSSASANSENP